MQNVLLRKSFLSVCSFLFSFTVHQVVAVHVFLEEMFLRLIYLLAFSWKQRWFYLLILHIAYLGNFV